MRKILTTTMSGLSALAAVGRRTCLSALLATSLTATSIEFATAQSPYGMMTSTMSVGDNAEQSDGLLRGAPTVDESESLVTGFGRASGGSSVPATLASMPSITGPAGGYYGDNMVSGGNACFTQGCDVRGYVNYEALWLSRGTDVDISSSEFRRLPASDYELGEYGGRITVGRLFDCTNGFEGVYTGPYKWQHSLDVSGAGNLDSRFRPSGGITAADIDTFNNANQHVETFEVKFNNFEANRTWWTWDVLQTLVGLRYVDYEENYAFSTASAAGNGLYLANIKNRAIGPQFGGLLMRPASLRASYGIRGKAAVFANFDELSTRMSNAGNLVVNANDSAVDLSGLIEMGLFVNYQIVPSIRVTAGWEFTYLPRFATLGNQNISSITPSSGTSIENDDDVFLNGGSVGVQVVY